MSTEQAAQLAAAMPKLLLAAARLSHAVAAGLHGRRRAGLGESFWQFRQWRPEDGAAAIDWRRSGSGDGLLLREREWEAPAVVALSLADTPGLQFHSSARLPPKRDRAVLLLLALALLLLRGGERVALAGRTPPLAGGQALDRLAAALLAGGGRTAPAAAAARQVWFGDFLAPDARFAGPPGGAVMQVLDPAECDFPYRGRVVFAGYAGEAEVDAARAQDWAAAYQARMAAQQAAVAQAAARAGQTCLLHRTDAAPATALAALYQALRR